MAVLMIVDDNEGVGRVIARTLRRLGHEITTFTSGIDALDFLHEPINPLPDLMILDFMMPDRDGLEVLRDLRAGLRGADLPVAMFTANDDPNLAILARDAGANDFWVKSRTDLFTISHRIRCLLSIHEPAYATTSTMEHVTA